MGGSAVASGSPIVDTNTKEYRRNKTFRAVEEVLKQRLRQREKTSQVGDPAVCADPNRNIAIDLAVGYGSRDIKSSLRQAKLPNGNPILLDDEQNALALLIEQARYELNCGSPLVAQGYLDQAMKIDDSEPLVRIERGVCKVRQSLSLEALENVDPVLSENPRHPLALLVKADALYHLGNFEHALVYYQRGLRYSTQDPEIFRLGIRRAVKAVKNAIGPKVTSYFDTMAEVVMEVPQHVLAQPPHQISSFTKEEKKSMPKEASSSKPFLGGLYGELQYLKRLQHTAKQIGLGKVAKEANEGLKFLDTREEFWRQHTPLYVQKTEQLEKFNMV